MIASALVLPLAAQAQTLNAQQGFYVGAGGGLRWAIDPAGPTWTGWAVNGKAGYDFVGPRAELEVGYGQIPNAAFAPGTAISGEVG